MIITVMCYKLYNGDLPPQQFGTQGIYSDYQITAKKYNYESLKKLWNFGHMSKL